MVAYLENGKERKSVVPQHWACSIDDEEVLFRPRKDTLRCIHKWVKPTGTWRQYPITKVIHEFGTKDTCHRVLGSHVDSTANESMASDSDETQIG